VERRSAVHRCSGGAEGRQAKPVGALEAVADRPELDLVGALGSWLRGYAGQVWLFTSEPAVEWTNNVSERGAKAAKRHQAVSGYWHTGATLARWCRIRSYLDSATAHGHTALDAISAALAGKALDKHAPEVGDEMLGEWRRAAYVLTRCEQYDRDGAGG